MEDNRFVVLLVSIGALAQVYVNWQVIAGHERPPITRDAALFEHAGWYINQGAGAYVDIWDPKPPLAFEVPAIVSLLTEDIYLLHMLHVVLMGGAAVGSIVLVGYLTKHLTGDPAAGIVGGLSMLILPGYILRPALGHKPKYLILFAGLAALVLFIRGHPFLSGVAAAVSAGIWQLGIIYPLVVTGLALHREGRRELTHVVAGIGSMVVAMLLPVALWGALEPMVAQAIIVPFLNPDGFSIPVRLVAGILDFRFGSVLVVLGVSGVLWFARERTATIRREWWVLACAAWFGFVVLFIDYDVWGYTDLVPGLPFVAIGIGLLYSMLPERRPRRVLVGILAAVVVLNVVFLGGFGVVFDPISVPEPDAELNETMDKSADYPPAPERVSETRYVYWNKVEPDNCHVRYSVHELKWIQKTGTYPSCEGQLDEALRLLLGG